MADKLLINVFYRTLYFHIPGKTFYSHATRAIWEHVRRALTISHESIHVVWYICVPAPARIIAAWMHRSAKSTQNVAAASHTNAAGRCRFTLPLRLLHAPWKRYSPRNFTSRWPHSHMGDVKWESVLQPSQFINISAVNYEMLLDCIHVFSHGNGAIQNWRDNLSFCHQSFEV